jgi:hypothetical protein
MLGRRSLPVGAFFMVLILALAGLGVGYGLWSKLLTIDGTVNTGTVNAIFDIAFTDDDNKIDNPDKDPNDAGPCPAFGSGSCDPSSFGPKPTRYDKDVAICVAELDAGQMSLTVTVQNGYPSYHCTVWYDILNNGTIPIKLQNLFLEPVNFTNGLEVTIGLSELACGMQIDPDKSSQADIHIHVEQEAAQEATYTFTGQLWLVQWNEYFTDLCTGTSG